MALVLLTGGCFGARSNKVANLVAIEDQVNGHVCLGIKGVLIAPTLGADSFEEKIEGDKIVLNLLAKKETREIRSSGEFGYLLIVPDQVNRVQFENCGEILWERVKAISQSYISVGALSISKFSVTSPLAMGKTLVELHVRLTDVMQGPIKRVILTQNGLTEEIAFLKGEGACASELDIFGLVSKDVQKFVLTDGKASLVIHE